MINLLPSVAKKKYHLELVRRLVMFYSIGLFVIVGVFIGLLYSVHMYLEIVKEATLESVEVFRKTPQYKALQESEKKVKSLNVQMQKVLALNNQTVRTTKVFTDVYVKLPPGIFINTMSLDVGTQKLSIGGFSLSRNDILRFKEDLEKLSWVKKINSPTSNILRETNSPFTLEIVTELKAN